MSNKKLITLYHNDDEKSLAIAKELTEKLEGKGFAVSMDMEDDTELLVCIGGDGTTIHAIQNLGFPDIPIVGVNTGHLGIFQEVSPDQIDQFIEVYMAGDYKYQTTKAVKAILVDEDGEHEYMGFNEIVLKGSSSYPVHFNISIGDETKDYRFIEKFSGDGIVMATSAGSTAYNYSLGGSIVDPRLDLLQVTPISPINNTVYRTFTTSILLPPDFTIKVEPVYLNGRNSTMLIHDGNEHVYENVKEIIVGLSDTEIKIIRFGNYDFWDKVKSKFL